MAIFGVEGNYGAGKTAFTSFCAYAYATFTGRPLYANYRLKGAITLHTIQDLYACEDGVVVLDEVHQMVNARRSTTNASLEFLSWYGQSRKLGCDMWFISQMARKVDVTVREMYDYTFSLTKVDGAWSRVHVYDLHDRLIRQFAFDRRLAIPGLYGHREFAHLLLPRPENQPKK